MVAVAISALSFARSASTQATGVPQWKAWLCFPGAANDWCSVDLTTTVFPAKGAAATVHVSIPDNPAIDCFYVYPTVSEERRGNATLEIHPEERETAITQAARFSHVCRVYAPLYRQRTAYANQYNGSRELAYSDVLAAWKDYLAHYNHGRGVFQHVPGCTSTTATGCVVAYEAWDRTPPPADVGPSDSSRQVLCVNPAD